MGPEHTRGESWVYFPHVLIGFHCWPIGFQIQKGVACTKTSVNLRPWERPARPLDSEGARRMQRHTDAGPAGAREKAPGHHDDVLTFMLVPVGQIPISQTSETYSFPF